jgi:hypothetical protein
MPLVRYFLFTGSMLLGLMFAADIYLPRPAEAVTPDIDRSIIRIHTSQRWPAAVPIDTSASILPGAPLAVTADSDMLLPAPVREAKAYVPAALPKYSDSPKSSDQARRPVKRMASSPPRETYARLAYRSNWSSDSR